MLFVALLLLSANLNMPKTVGAKDKHPGARKSRAGADLARRQSQAAKSAGSADIRGVFARPASCVSTAAASAAPVADAAAAAAIVAAALATNISTPTPRRSSTASRRAHRLIHPIQKCRPLRQMGCACT